MFQPLKDGKAAGPFIVFADGFAGAVKDPGQASFRPSGLAMGPDGALYISEDTHGRIWRVTYHGEPGVALAPAASPKIADVTSGQPGPPEGTHPDAGRMTLASLPVPPGATKEEVAWELDEAQQLKAMITAAIKTGQSSSWRGGPDHQP